MADVSLIKANKSDMQTIWIMSEYRNKGYASAAIKAAEDIHGANNWIFGYSLNIEEML
ncbi:hypothetical protein [Pseudobutyrivibrio xylanivorans]|uniref:hypothetical protein n=1 Tax=Pseudobutyrivibrio xylanivorans TaxID=185007 RepID=UPI001580C0D1|nr:hypothetical protein [Pseudobutyrivibrio xylanivorans]